MNVGVYVSVHEHGGPRTTSWSWFSPSTMCWSSRVTRLGTESSPWTKNIFISEHKWYLSKDYSLWLADKLHPQAQEQMSRYDHFPEITMERRKANTIRRWVTPPQRWARGQRQHRERTAGAGIARLCDPLGGWQATGFLSPAHPPQPHRHLSLQKEVSLCKAHILGLLSSDNI